MRFYINYISLIVTGNGHFDTLFGYLRAVTRPRSEAVGRVGFDRDISSSF
jgi:hypothetical protein